MANARIFIDFWNLQIALNKLTGREFYTDFPKLSKWLIEKSSDLVNTEIDFDGMRVYLSYNKESIGDKKLILWAKNSLAQLPGINVTILERRPKGHPICQACHKEIASCPYCNEKLHQTVEKGVDTSIVTDLLGLAWEKALDIAILVSADRDFIPAVNLLSTKGLRVINAYVPPTGKELTSVCWANINLSDGLINFEDHRSGRGKK